MFKKLAKQLRSDETFENNGSYVSSPQESLKEQTKSAFLKSMSTRALNLYEKKSDIRKFTRLALSDSENQEHDAIVNQLFCEGVRDPFSDSALNSLVNNERFLKDIFH